MRLKYFRREITVVFIVASICFLLSTGPAAAINPQPEPPGIGVFVDGSPLTMDVAPLIEQGRTLVPLRAIFEALGATVEWNVAERSIAALKGDLSVLLYIGNTTAQKNGVQVALDVPPRIVSGRTLVPLRFVSEALGAGVEWDGTARKVIIVSEPTTPQEPGTPTQPGLSPQFPGVSLQLPDWVKSGLKLSFVDKKFDSALIYNDKLAVKSLEEALSVKSNLVYTPPRYNLQPICWDTGCDYSPFVTFTGNQDGAGGCIGRSIIHVMNILKECEHPYTPDLSFWYLAARQDELVQGGPPDTNYVLEHNGVCSEASMPSDFDKAKPLAQGGWDFSALPQPSAATNSEAGLYKVYQSIPCAPTEYNIKYLLKTFGPLTAAGDLAVHREPDPNEGHCVTIGYDDVTKTFKCLNSYGDTWGPWGAAGNGFFTVPYDKLAENFNYVKFYENIPSDRTGTAHAYTARIHVETQGLSRNKLTVKVGVTGGEPAVTVWGTPNETLWVDKSKTLCIDVPLPAYAKSYWPPGSGNDWYVQITNNSGWTAEVKEITFARLYKKPDGSFATETFKSTETGTKIEAGKSKVIYVPTPQTPPLPGQFQIIGPAG